MTTLRQAAQQALKALSKWSSGCDVDAVELNNLILALEAALEQPEQEPVAERFEAMHSNRDVWITTIAAAQIARSTTPPAAQRKPLTNEQIDDIAGGKVDYFDRRVFARAVEATHGIKEQS